MRVLKITLLFSHCKTRTSLTEKN